MHPLLVLAAMLGTMPAEPAMAPPVSAAAETVTLIFQPPLDQPIRYRIAQSRAQSDRVNAASEWVEELRFAKAGAGYTLQWKIDPASAQEILKDPALAPLLLPFTTEVITFDVDAEGEVLRARDWDTVRPRLLEIVDKLPLAAGTTAAERAQAKAQIRSLFEGMTAEQAPAILLKSLQPVLGWGGTSTREGEVRETTGASTIPMFNIPLERTTSVTLESATADRATFRIRSTVTKEALTSMIAGMAERVGIPLDSEKGREMQAQLSQLASAMTDESVASFDRATALPRHLRNDRRASIGGKALQQTLEITRLD